jgi:hypothetical protein
LRIGNRYRLLVNIAGVFHAGPLLAHASAVCNFWAVLSDPRGRSF